METENLDEPPNPTTSTPVATLTTAQLPDAQYPTTNDNNDDGDPAVDPFFEDYDYIDSNCSTPFVSAPSSPGRTTFLPSSGGGGYFYSAPASPMHFLLSNAAANSARSSGYVPSPSESSLTAGGSFEFEFSARFTSSSSSSNTHEQRCTEIPTEVGSMSSADELFLNGQIRPMKLSSHLQRPQFLAPLIDIAESEGDECGSNEHGEAVENNDENGDAFPRSRTYWRLRDKSVRRRARSMSPMRNNNDNAALFDWCEPVNVDGAARVEEEDQKGKLKLDEVTEMMLKAQQGRGGEGRKELEVSAETTPSSASASSSRCSSAGRSSKRWVFLKDFLRSKSEGRNNGKFWSNISFSPIKEKKGSSISSQQGQQPASTDSKEKGDQTGTSGVTSAETQKPPKKATKKSSTPPPTNGIRMGKRRVPLSAHEMHYTANRAQAEEMRKKTYLPYRQGLLGCLGFSSKSYGAMNGFARALNPVSSR